MLETIINNIPTEIADLKLTHALGAVGSYSFVAPSHRFPDTNTDFQNLRYSLTFKGYELLSEGIIENGTPAIDEQGILNTIAFKGTDEIGLLLLYGAKSNAVYLEEKMLFIIDDLLTKIDNWKLGYTYGISATDTFTIDARQKETLFAQIKGLSEYIPDLYFRYGGVDENDGYHRLDVGMLGRTSGIQFTQGINCEPFKKLPRSTKKLYEIEAFGGTSDIRELYLKDAYDSDPDFYGNHPVYPIVEKSDGTWVVYDLTTPTGDAITKFYKDIKVVYPPEATNPSPPPDTVPWTTEEKEAFHVQAGPALWQACVKEFKKANTQFENYETTAYFPLTIIDESTGIISAGGYVTNELYNIIINQLGQAISNESELQTVYARINQAYQESIFGLLPGDYAYLSGKMQQYIYSRQTGSYIWKETLTLEGFYFLSDVNIEFTPELLIKVYIKTGIQNYQTLFEDEQFLARKGEKPADLLGVGYTTPVSLGVELLTDTQTGVVPDATMSDGTLAKLFSFTTPSIPLGTTELRFSYYTDKSNAVVEILQNPSIVPANFIARATFDGDWDINKSLTLYGVFIFR